MTHRAISLFSGCGGLDLGAEAAGVSIILANDINSDSCATLRKYFQHTTVVESDIANLTAFPDAEIVLGGYPCQSFSMGGLRNPSQDSRTYLYLEFARCVDSVDPLYFIAENVSGLQKVRQGEFLTAQIDAFRGLGTHGYNLSAHVVDAKDYGVAQTRKRVFIVGVRKDLGKVFRFPSPTHGKRNVKNSQLLPFVSHGEAIRDFPLWPSGEFYERPHDPEGHWSWYYMSRNRKAKWDGPSYTVVANWRHTTLHPASPVMKLTWSNLADGWKQRWDFSGEYEHLVSDSTRPILEEPRRLSWRECAVIQTFPLNYEPEGDVESKFSQIGNAVPPRLAETVISHLISEKGLIPAKNAESYGNQIDLEFGSTAHSF